MCTDTGWLPYCLTKYCFSTIEVRNYSNPPIFMRNQSSTETGFPFSALTHPQHFLFTREGENLRANNRGAGVECEDVADERITVPLADHHVGNLNHWVFVSLWENAWNAHTKHPIIIIWLPETYKSLYHHKLVTWNTQITPPSWSGYLKHTNHPIVMIWLPETHTHHLINIRHPSWTHNSPQYPNLIN